MIKFAVCDDERDVTEYISDKLREYYPKECEIKKYTDGKSLLEDIRSESFDVFFLDIGMPSLDGFEIAKRIRNNDPHAKIVFVTGKEELAHRGYIYGAFRFVRKSRLDQELCETAVSLSQIFSLSNGYMNFKTWTGEILIDIKSIRYFKANGHSLILYGSSKEEIRVTMKEMEELLKKREFIRIHKSYLVNLRFFYSLESSSVKLSSGEELPISRNKIPEVKRKIHEYCQSKDERVFS